MRTAKLPPKSHLPRVCRDLGPRVVTAGLVNAAGSGREYLMVVAPAVELASGAAQRLRVGDLALAAADGARLAARLGIRETAVLDEIAVLEDAGCGGVV